MNSIQIICLLIILMVLIIAFIKYNVASKETFTEATNCVLSSQDMESLLDSLYKIKNAMNDLADFPWPDRNKFQMFYTAFVTRFEYLLNTYNNTISIHHLKFIIENNEISKVIDYFFTNHLGLMNEVFEEMMKIITLLEKNNSDSCIVCDSLHIQHKLENIDHEFSMYMKYTFDKEDVILEERNKKQLANLEIDMFNLTTLIKNAIKTQKFNSKGQLDHEYIDDKVVDIDNKFLLISSDLDLFKSVKKTLGDIKTFIEIKKMIINDLKQCILTPII